MQTPLANQGAEIDRREAAVRAQEAELAKARGSIDEQIAHKLKTERQRISADELKRAKLIVAAEIEQKAREVADLHEILRQRDEKLAEAQTAQAELIRKKRELDDARRELDLTVERRITESLDEIRTKTRKEVEDAAKLTISERDQTIEGMRRTIEELKRKSDQGSQQLQGDVQELELEALLRNRFPRDTIERVGKGEFGGDVLQTVYGAAGQKCGTILWESKRTKNWSDSWLAKLRTDQRRAGAEIALIVSQALPKGLETFDLIEGIWVAEFRCVVPVAIAVRHCLLEVSSARTAGEGQKTKMALVYHYLTGPQFRRRIEALVEKIGEMRSDLDRERNTMTRLWAKREQQIAGFIDSAAGLYGDLQGIAGKSLQEIEGLNLPLLGGPAEASLAD